MGKRRTLLGAVATAGVVAGAGMAGAAGPLDERQKLTVGGWLLSGDGGRVYVAGELPCPVEGDRRGVDNPNLQVQTEDGVFHLASAETSCAGEGGQAGGHLSGEGVGSLNGVVTQITFEFTDGGNSGRTDQVAVELGPRGVQGSAGGPLEQGSIRMGKTFNHIEVSAR